MALTKIFSLIPEVTKPEEKKVGFNTKLKWTLIVFSLILVQFSGSRADTLNDTFCNVLIYLRWNSRHET